MIKNFFHALNQSNVQYMLISGQATILYGAATFSDELKKLNRNGRLLKVGATPR